MSLDQQSSTIHAVVRALDGETALVEVEAGGCGRCHEKGGCGGQQLTQMFCSGPKTYRVDNSLGAKVGDRVTVAISEGSVRRTANLAYVLPLTATIAGSVLGSFFGGDLVAVAGAVSGLALALIYVRFRAQDSSGKFTERPHIVSLS